MNTERNDEPETLEVDVEFPSGVFKVEAPVRLYVTKSFSLTEEGRGKREFVAGNVYHFTPDEAEVLVGRGDATADIPEASTSADAGTVTASKDHYPALPEVKAPETSVDHPPTDLKEKS